LTKKISAFEGLILDVGCGNKPYESFTKAEKYIGIDVIDAPEVDYLMIDNKYIPFEDSYFDAVISTQVIEHIQDLDTVIHEIKRAAKPDAKILISLPFMFQQHGAPEDYRRFTKFGIKNYLSQFDFDIIEITTLGGIGTYLIVGLVCWLEFQSGSIYVLVRFVSIPLYLFLMPVLNIIGIILNKLDTTDSFYTSVVCLAKNSKKN
jgi:SAM-dependent methyltransferase